MERGRERAAAERLAVDWVEGDAEALPFDDGSFDIVLSTFGSMFAPDHARAAQEMLRVCRSGGRIGMSNWTPDGLMGELFQTIVKHAPPPIKIDPPGLWGVEEYVRRLFGDGISSMDVTTRDFVMRASSIERGWGSSARTSDRSRSPTPGSGAGEQALTADLTDMMRRRNRPGEQALAAPARYIDIVAHRR